MTTISTDDPLAAEVTAAIRTGDLETLSRLLADHPGLATARLGDDDPDGMSRSLLHVVTDWPGHFPCGPETVAVLVAAGADVNARFCGSHAETPLHWAASSDDVGVLDALLEAGADIEADGAVIGGGTPLMDARAFGCWGAAYRLVERGAHVGLYDAAGLGLRERLEEICAADPPDPGDVDNAFWCASAGGRLDTAAFLLARGADIDHIPPWAPDTPLDVAAGSGNHAMLTWLHERGARTSSDLAGC